MKHRRTARPKKSVYLPLLLTILGAVSIAFGAYFHIGYRNTVAACTANSVGTVTAVDVKSVKNSRSSSGSHLEYKATITFGTPKSKDSVTIKSEWDRKAYTQGDTVNIKYDPDDTAVNYIDGRYTDHGKSIAMMGLLLMLPAVICNIYRIKKAKTHNP